MGLKIEHNKKELLEDFKKNYDEFSELKLTKFTRWMKEAARIKGFGVSERKSGVDRLIKFRDGKLFEAGSDSEPTDLESTLF